MQVFLCSFGDYSVAIPMDSISSLYLYTKDVQEIDLSAGMVIHGENRTFFSLLRLFNLSHENIRHCIILKDPDNIGGETVLLITRVECEINIPDDEIYPVPAALKNMQFSMFFAGIKFDLNGNLILLLNPEQIKQFIQRELTV